MCCLNLSELEPDGEYVSTHVAETIKVRCEKEINAILASLPLEMRVERRVESVEFDWGELLLGMGLLLGWTGGKLLFFGWKASRESIV